MLNWYRNINESAEWNAKAAGRKVHFITYHFPPSHITFTLPKYDMFLRKYYELIDVTAQRDAIFSLSIHSMTRTCALIHKCKLCSVIVDIKLSADICCQTFNSQ